ncbi:hypothetical protein DPMN_177534 [Dreissena polymorpha]|uniref:Uncharacterized protein n=1 Tax=Dreissena polymorpha TaxID=45954 RepID=A0A9D4IJ36_DREPO|nr:hypothetical protein DPMN_177534 [Dreissena polymorpha]
MIHSIINPESKYLLRPCSLQPLVNVAVVKVEVGRAAPEHMAVSAALLLHCWVNYQYLNLTEAAQQVYLLPLQ